MRRFVPLLLALLAAPAWAQQVTLPRVEAMPALPSDYRLRDWDRVARGYDSLAFDPARTGQYFPLVALYSGTVNYPAHGSFGLETYVGQGNEIPGEAINALPAIVGGSLVGADKRAQYGVDWVLRSEEWFNRRPAEDVYLNGPQATSGSDWWYDTMPNVFFYQLRARYPGYGDSDRQFTRVADRWLQAVGALGGRATPWALPAITYRAFRLSTMTPRLDGVPEPEAAGAIAWILYSAYRETGAERYRIGAEQLMDALLAQTQNPSYELQLPYGTLAAARMNAELGTSYDIAKMLNWSFNRGPLRGWGTISGISRGGYTLDGLVGEVDGDGYAFALNGFQQAAALVPVARYDDRFARALGRWMVNLASASRLFYSTSLPDANQDSESWARPNDPRGLIAYEALRGTWQGVSPFATGDAVRGGWAPTNLALYGSSSVGYLAAVVDSTEVPGVLRLNLRATDVYRTPSYQSFLVYNPHPTARTVTVPLTFGTYDVYDAAADAFLARGVSGRPAVEIPGDAARVLVFPTSGGTETVVDGRLLVNGVVVDYRYGTPPNRLPRVRALVASDSTLARGQMATLWCTGGDAETASPAVSWSATGGTLTPDGARATFSSPEAGDFSITCAVTDGAGQTANASVTIRVVVNQPPDAPTVTASRPSVDLGGQTTLTCSATDPDGDPLVYTWSAPAGQTGGPGPTTTYTAPTTPGYYRVDCTATDPSGAATVGSGYVTAGRLILDLPLDGGTAADQSGFGHDGEVNGPAPAPGRTGAPATALAFDGTDDAVSVAGGPALNPTDAVTVSVWARPTALPNRESFLVSHGSWQNRWKLSLTPEGRPRWTVKTNVGIVDLDAPNALVAGAFVHLAATYDGAALKLYVGGALAAERAHTGAMPTVTLPLLLGQMLPGQSDYNFGGVLDDVRVYNRALTAQEILEITTGETADEPGPSAGPLALGAPYPNPARGRVTIPLRLRAGGDVHVRVLDVLGREVAVLHDGPLAAGEYRLAWEGEGPAVASGVYVVRVEADGAALTRRFLLVR